MADYPVSIYLLLAAGCGATVPATRAPAAALRAAPSGARAVPPCDFDGFTVKLTYRGRPYVDPVEVHLRIDSPDGCHWSCKGVTVSGTVTCPWLAKCGRDSVDGEAHISPNFWVGRYHPYPRETFKRCSEASYEIDRFVPSSAPPDVPPLETHQAGVMSPTGG